LSCFYQIEEDGAITNLPLKERNQVNRNLPLPMIQGVSLVLAVGIPLTEGIAVEMEEAVVEIDCSKFDKRSVLHHFFA
jgi:hypothetical protein